MTNRDDYKETAKTYKEGIKKVQGKINRWLWFYFPVFLIPPLYQLCVFFVIHPHNILKITGPARSLSSGDTKSTFFACKGKPR